MLDGCRNILNGILNGVPTHDVYNMLSSVVRRCDAMWGLFSLLSLKIFVASAW